MLLLFYDNRISTINSFIMHYRNQNEPNTMNTNKLKQIMDKDLKFSISTIIGFLFNILLYYFEFITFVILFIIFNIIIYFLIFRVLNTKNLTLYESIIIIFAKALIIIYMILFYTSTIIDIGDELL